MLSAKEYHRTLPSKRMASGAVLRNLAGAVLVVEPVYKSLWELPGGVVESGESPLAAVVREVREELGIEVDAKAFTLVSLDYLNETDERTEALQFLFAGPELNEMQIGAIRLPREELRGFAFLCPEDAARRLGPVVGSRLLRAIDAIRSQSVVYWEGSPCDII
jgi:8-oxo-dGTP pyrophosphatase MutT (NUDIX family)